MCVTGNTNTGTVTLVSQICEIFENNFDFRYLYKRWRSFQHTVKHRKGLFCKNTEHLEAIKCFRKKASSTTSQKDFGNYKHFCRRTSEILMVVLGQYPRRKIAPNPKTNPKSNPNPNLAGIFLGGQLSGCPPTPKLILTLALSPTLARGQFSSGGNCPDTPLGF